MSVTAKVKVSFEVGCGSNWSDATTMDQIKKQAIEGALGAIRRCMEKNPEIRILGNPEVISVHVTSPIEKP